MKKLTRLFSINKNWPFLIALALLIPLSGCIVYDQNPLYEKKDLLTTPDLSGVWMSETKDTKDSSNNPVTLELQADNTYKWSGQEDGKPSAYSIGIVKLNGRYFLDLTPLSGKALENATSEDRPKGHAVFRLNLKGKDRFRVDVLNEDWLKDQLTKGKIKVDHTEIKLTPTSKPDEVSWDDEDLCLMASTQDLKKFYASIANEEKAWDKGDSDVIRKK